MFFIYGFGIHLFDSNAIAVTDWYWQWNTSLPGATNYYSFSLIPEWFKLITVSTEISALIHNRLVYALVIGSHSLVSRSEYNNARLMLIPQICIINR